jgi:hypothetical protein
MRERLTSSQSILPVVGERSFGFDGTKQQLRDRTRRPAGSDNIKGRPDVAQAVCLSRLYIGSLVYLYGCRVRTAGLFLHSSANNGV